MKTIVDEVDITSSRVDTMNKMTDSTGPNGALAQADSATAGRLDAVVELDPQVSLLANTLLDELRAQNFPIRVSIP